MISSPTPDPTTPEELIGLLVAHLRMLEICYEARERGLSPGDVPVDCCQLVRLGASREALVWMLYHAHVDHLRAGPDGWTPKPSAVVGDDSALVLTAVGEAFAEVLVAALVVPEGHEGFHWTRQLRVGAMTPRYDKENRLLAWGRHELKRYRQPSGNQETILLAAEELLWAQWFDDPLPREAGVNPKVRLHDAIKRLNRHQTPYLVHFKGDGTGRRVGWELR